MYYKTLDVITFSIFLTAFSSLYTLRCQSPLLIVWFFFHIIHNYKVNNFFL